MQPNQPIGTTSTPPQNVHNPLKAMRQGEQVVFEIKRHPIGMLGVYISFGLLLVFVAIGAILAPDMLPDVDRRVVSNIGLLAFLISAAFALVFSYIARTVYYGNRWILTTDSLTQITQNSLFSKQSSQLGLDNLEDVTVEQRGIFAHLFKYGVLRCQTAGEHGKFLITFCPNPNEYAQKMLIARENFEHGEVHAAAPQAQPAPQQAVPTQTDLNAPR